MWEWIRCCGKGESAIRGGVGKRDDACGAALEPRCEQGASELDLDAGRTQDA